MLLFPEKKYEKYFSISSKWINESKVKVVQPWLQGYYQESITFIRLVFITNMFFSVIYHMYSFHIREISFFCLQQCEAFISSDAAE